MYTILLENNVTKAQKRYENIANLTENGMYFTFEIDSIDLTDGEYTIFLIDENNKVIASDLAIVGNYHPNTITYNSSRKFRTYNG